MSRCNVDIETFSSVGLAKCGVFKCAESPDCCCEEMDTCAAYTRRTEEYKECNT